MTFRWNKHPLLSLFSSHIIEYPTPINLNYMWSFGSAAGICLVIQIITGIFLAMYYTPHIDYAFLSIEFIMRNVNNGWIIRYLHANGASIFFIVVYCHILRGLYFGSYIQPRGSLWMSGVLLFILMMTNVFVGYVLPLGQISFWGVTVITNFFSAIPYIFNFLIQLLAKLLASSILFFIKRNSNNLLEFKYKKFYFCNIEIPDSLSLRACQRYSFIIKQIGLKNFNRSMMDDNSEMSNIVKEFINIINKNNKLQIFLDYFTNKEDLNRKDLFLLDFISPKLMVLISEFMYYDLLENNNKISNRFYYELYENLDFEKPDKDRLISFFKNLENPKNLIDFWLS